MVNPSFPSSLFARWSYALSFWALLSFHLYFSVLRSSVLRSAARNHIAASSRTGAANSGTGARPPRRGLRYPSTLDGGMNHGTASRIITSHPP